MTAYSRAVIAVAAGASLIGLVGCSDGDAADGNEAGGPRSSAEGGLGDFQPCSFLKPTDLEAAGVQGPGEPENDIESEPGCTFEGESVFLSLYKNQEQTVDSYQAGGSWDEYEKVDINGRGAARAIASGSGGNNVCSTLLDAGGGVVQVKVTAVLPDEPLDACAEANKVASSIEPRLPE